MKNHLKRYSRLMLLGLTTTFTLASLTGCLHRKKTTYQTYMQNILDVNYKGSFDGYVDDNDGSKDDAQAMYDDTIDYLSVQLINHYSLANADSDEVKNIFNDTAKTIYSQAKYEVSQAYKNGDDYYVDVTVYPMDILNQVFDDVFAYIEDSNKKIAAGDYNNTGKEDYEAQFAQGVADIIQEKTSNMEYRSPVVISVKITDDGNYYCADPSGLSQVDASMLAIEGSHDGDSGDSESDSSKDGSSEDSSSDDNDGGTDISSGVEAE